MESRDLIYQHTQTGTPARLALGGMAAISFLLPTILPGNPTWLFWGFGLLGIALWISLLLFHSLRVWVSEEELGLSFGVGLVRKKIPLSEMTSAKRVKTTWLNGWGIHLTPHGWLYNISGFDAIELGLGEKKRVLIGTDDPEGLLQALQQAKPSICILEEP